MKISYQKLVFIVLVEIASKEQFTKSYYLLSVCYLRIVVLFQLARSQVMGSRAGSSEVSTTRTSKTGWLKDSDHAVVAKLTARIAGVTGLNTDPDKEDAELLQVANYMNGGHYNPHTDYVMREKVPDHVRHC